MRRQMPLSLLLFALALVAGCDEVPDLSLPNEAPRANNDSVVIRQDANVDIDVGANDTDVDGNVVTLEIVDAPTHGAALTVGLSVIRYTPERLYTGPDTLTYRLIDAEGESDTATVSVTVKARQSRALFTTTDDGSRRLYMLDSRAPDDNSATAQLSELSLNLDGESVLDWKHDAIDQTVHMLTSGNRIVTVPLSDPENPAALESIDLPLAAGETLDNGLALALNVRQLVYSVNHRYVRSLDLLEGNIESFDTGWTNSTMEVEAVSITASNVVMRGTLGDPPLSSIYLVNLADEGSLLALQQADDAEGTMLARVVAATNSLVWLLQQPGPVGSGPYNCQQPPPQLSSDLFYVPLLSAQQDSITNINETSGLLGDPTNLLSYNFAELDAQVYVAACPPGSESVQLAEISLVSPSTAGIVAALPNPDDALYSVDPARNGQQLIYTYTDPEARAVHINTLTDAVTALEPLATQFTAYSENDQLRLPASAMSSDGQRWLFVAAPDGAANQLVWVELAALQQDPADPDAVTTLMTTLPLAPDHAPVSDGYHAFVASSAAGQSSVAMAQPGITPTAFEVPGTLETEAGPLDNPAWLLVPVPLDELP